MVVVPRITAYWCVPPRMAHVISRVHTFRLLRYSIFSFLWSPTIPMRTMLVSEWDTTSTSFFRPYVGKRWRSSTRQDLFISACGNIGWNGGKVNTCESLVIIHIRSPLLSTIHSRSFTHRLSKRANRFSVHRKHSSVSS